MVIQHLMSHGLFYALFVNLYLFILMISTSPRVWGYADYPQVVKDKVLPQTRRENPRWAALVYLYIWISHFFDLCPQIETWE